MRAIFRRHASLFVAVAGFSLFANVLVLAAPLYMLQVYDRVLTSRSLETLGLLSIIALIGLAAFAWLDSLRMQLMARAAVRMEAAAAGIVLGHTIAQSTINGAPYRYGLRDLRAIRTFLSSAGAVAFMDIPWCPVFIALIWLFHPAMGYVAIGGVLVLLVLAGLDDRVNRAAVERSAQAARRAADLTDDALRNADVARALGMVGALQRRASLANEQATQYFLSAGRASNRILAFSKLLRQALQVVMLGLGAYLVIRQQVSPGVMIAGTILLSRAMAPIEAAIAGWRLMMEARSAYRRVDAFIAQAQPAEPMPLPAPTGRVQVERAWFSVDRNTPILKNIAFAIEPGQLLGLIGPSGAGKTMLGRMLVGILKPTAGTVRLDGAELSQWESDQLGAHLGYLPQDVQLFEGTIAQNIARMKSVQGEHERIVAAATLAGVHELVLKLPGGYDTPLGPGGHALSAGQRQMVGLARALYGEPKLVVLDEPNANLDGAGEEKLLAALRVLRERACTVVLITHRPALLRDAHKVLVLHAGEVADFGERDTVLGKFARVAAARPEPQRAVG